MVTGWGGDWNIGLVPIGSMYSIFTYIWLIYGVNVDKYSIHGSYGYGIMMVNNGQQWLIMIMVNNHW